MKKSVKGRKRNNRKKAKEDIQIDSKSVMSLEDIAEVLGNIRFRKAFRGVSEEDVWRKIKELDEMYRRIYDMQEQKYRTLLNTRLRSKGEKTPGDVSEQKVREVRASVQVTRKRKNSPEGRTITGGSQYE